MSARMPLAEQLRKRLMEVTARIKERAVFGQLGYRGQIQVGGGALIKNVMNVTTEILDRATARIKELKPGVIPVVSETIERLQPGKRISELLTPAAPSGGVAPKREVSPPPETKTVGIVKLRE